MAHRAPASLFPSSCPSGPLLPPLQEGFYQTALPVLCLSAGPHCDPGPPTLSPYSTSAHFSSLLAQKAGKRPVVLLFLGGCTFLLMSPLPGMPFLCWSLSCLVTAITVLVKLVLTSHPRGGVGPVHLIPLSTIMSALVTLFGNSLLTPMFFTELWRVHTDVLSKHYQPPGQRVPVLQNGSPGVGPEVLETLPLPHEAPLVSRWGDVPGFCGSPRAGV